MKFLPLIATLLVAACPLAYAADVAPTKTRVNNRCTSYAMCVAEAGTGECQDSTDTDEIVHQVGRFAHYTFYSTKSTSTDYSCDIHTSNVGFNAATTTDQVNTTSITDEAPVYTMAVLLHYLWVACTTNSGEGVTIDAVICAME
jgi:hypothetical protein